MLSPPRRKTATHQSRPLSFQRGKNAAYCRGQNQYRATSSSNLGLPRFPIMPTAAAARLRQSTQNRQEIHVRPNKAIESIAPFSHGV